MVGRATDESKLAASNEMRVVEGRAVAAGEAGGACLGGEGSDSDGIGGGSDSAGSAGKAAAAAGASATGAPGG